MPTDASFAQTPVLSTPFNASHEAAIAAGLKTINGNQGLTMIAGPKGWGRRAVLSALVRRIQEDVIVERIEGAPLDVSTLTARLGAVLGVPVEDTADDLRATGAALMEALSALAAEGQRLALVIDAGEGASARALLLLERMCRSDALCCVIGARGALCAALSSGDNTRLRTLAQSAVAVRAFTQDEIAAMAAEAGLAADHPVAQRLWQDTEGAPEMVWDRLPGIAAQAAEIEAATDAEVDALEADSFDVDSFDPDAAEPDASPAAGPTELAETRNAEAAERSDRIDEAAAELTASLEQALSARNLSPSPSGLAEDEDENGLWLDEDARPRRKGGLLLGAAAAALVAVGVIGVVDTGVLDTAPSPIAADMQRAAGGLTFDMEAALAPASDTDEATGSPLAAMIANAPTWTGTVAPERGDRPVDAELRTADAGPTEAAQLALAPRAAPRPGRAAVDAAQANAFEANEFEANERAANVLEATGADVETSNAIRVVAETALGAASAGAEALAATGVMSETLDGIAAGANERRVSLSRARQLESLDGDAIEQRVRAALILADRRIAVKQFTEPSGVSAYDVLLNAWEVAPTDARLNKRFNRLVEVYRGEARRALSQERFGDFYRFNTVVDRILARRAV